METKAEDSIHKLRLKINDTAFDNYNDPTLIGPEEFNSNSSFMGGGQASPMRKHSTNFLPPLNTNGGGNSDLTTNTITNNNDDPFIPNGPNATYISANMPSRSPYPSFYPTGISQPFDALHSRRRLLNELSSNSMIRTDIPLLSRSGQRPLSYFSGTIDQSMSPLNIVTNQTYTGAIFNETIASNDMDELIDVMAKRRLAIKKLENEMNRQHNRASCLIRNFEEPCTTTISRPNLKYIDTYAPYERQSRFNNLPAYHPMFGAETFRAGSPPCLPRAPSNLNSSIEYPSEVNREIYSTYLVDSVRPHHSAKRLLSGRSLPSRQVLIQNPQPGSLETSTDLEVILI